MRYPGSGVWNLIVMFLDLCRLSYFNSTAYTNYPSEIVSSLFQMHDFCFHGNTILMYLKSCEILTSFVARQRIQSVLTLAFTNQV